MIWTIRDYMTQRRASKNILALAQLTEGLFTPGSREFYGRVRLDHLR